MATKHDTRKAFNEAMSNGLHQLTIDWVQAGMPGNVLHDLLFAAFADGVTEGLKRGVSVLDEALNSGDGSYRP